MVEGFKWGWEQVGRSSSLCGISALEVTGNFIAVSFELQFQEDIFVTEENNNKKRN